MSSNSPRLLVHVLLLIAMAACAATEEATRPDLADQETIGVGAGRGAGAGTGPLESAAHPDHSVVEGTATPDADLDADLDAGLNGGLDDRLDEEMEWLREARR